MPRVSRIYESTGYKGRWYAELEGGETLAVSVALIADYSLYSGRELEEAELERLKAGCAELDARERALRLLGYRAMSRRELTDKLTEKGVTPEAAESAADFLERAGYLNDAQYASQLVRHYSRLGYGPGRVRQELFRRGVPRELWEEALSELPEDTDAIDALIERRLRGNKPDRRELKRLTDMLIRRGFSWSEIKSALGRHDFSEGIEDE